MVRQNGSEILNVRETLSGILCFWNETLIVIVNVIAYHFDDFQHSLNESGSGILSHVQTCSCFDFVPGFDLEIETCCVIEILIVIGIWNVIVTWSVIEIGTEIAIVNEIGSET